MLLTASAKMSALQPTEAGLFILDALTRSWPFCPIGKACLADGILFEEVLLLLLVQYLHFLAPGRLAPLRSLARHLRWMAKSTQRASRILRQPRGR